MIYVMASVGHGTHLDHQHITISNNYV